VGGGRPLSPLEVVGADVPGATCWLGPVATPDGLVGVVEGEADDGDVPGSGVGAGETVASHDPETQLSIRVQAWSVADGAPAYVPEGEGPVPSAMDVGSRTSSPPVVTLPEPCPGTLMYPSALTPTVTDAIPASSMMAGPYRNALTCNENGVTGQRLL
jgi:hypothetical protein